jgi:hypothetical protein
MWCKPAKSFIEEVKAGSIYQTATAGLVFSSEEDGGGKDTLEALHDSAIMAAVLGEAEEVEHLGGALETNDPALLLNGKRGYPDGNEAVRPKSRPKSGWPVISRKNRPLRRE